MNPTPKSYLQSLLLSLLPILYIVKHRWFFVFFSPFSISSYTDYCHLSVLRVLVEIVQHIDRENKEQKLYFCRYTDFTRSFLCNLCIQWEHQRLRSISEIQFIFLFFDPPNLVRRTSALSYYQNHVWDRFKSRTVKCIKLLQDTSTTRYTNAQGVFLQFHRVRHAWLLNINTHCRCW